MCPRSATITPSPSIRYAAGQVEVVRGPATLRYGSQAIGGVVNAVNNRIPEAIPAARHSASRPAAASARVDDGRNGACMVEAGAGNFAVHADAFARTRRRLPHPASPGRQLNTSLDSEGYSLGGSYVFKDGFVGVAYSSFASTYFIPGIEAAERQEPHRAQPDQVDQQGRVARQRLRPRGDPLLARRHRLQARRGRWPRRRLRHRLDVSPTSSTKRAWRRSTCPSRPASASCAAPSACSGRTATCRPQGADGILLAPTQHAEPCRLHVRGAAADQEAALPGRRPHRERRREGHGLDLPAEFLPPPDDPDQTPAKRTFMPKSASAGFLYDLPLGVVARLTGAARRARARCHRALLQGPARLDRRPSRSAPPA